MKKEKQVQQHDQVSENPTHSSSFWDIFFEDYPNRDMSKETYETNIQIKRELIQKYRSKQIYVSYLCVSVIIFIILTVAAYNIYPIDHGSYSPPMDYLSFCTHYHLDISILLFFLCAVFYVLTCSSTAMSRHKRLSNLEAHIYAYERFQLQRNMEKDLYETSIQMSYKYLDQYYRETREQASRGFFITLIVSIIGTLIMVIGIISMFFNATSAAYVTTASGVIIEFISSIFFHLYNKTIQSMGNYHNKLVLSQNVAIALKVSETIDGPEKNAVKRDMIRALTADINQHINTNKNGE